MRRSGVIVVVVSVLAILAGLGAVLAGAPRAAAESLSPRRQAQESVLRLTELPAGYVLGGRYFCGLPRRPSEEGGEVIVESGEREPPTPYDEFLAHNATNSCVFAYERLYRPAGAPAGPTVVFSFSVGTPSVEAATEVLADEQLGEELAADTIAEEVVERGLRPAGSPPALGEGSLRFHTDRFYWDSHSHMAGTLVLWRQGKLVAGILAGGAKAAVNDTAADRYGALQQELMEAPRPYEQAEADDIPTFLGNPNLGVPAYWLGKEFKPGNGITYSFFRADDREHLTHPVAGRRMSVQYSNVLVLDSWTPAGWRRFSRTEPARGQTDPRCGRSRTLKLREGHAVIYAAYRTHRKGDPTCPGVRAGTASAHVFLPGVVVAVGVSLCRGCEDDELGPEFNSVAAVEKLVRGLHRWRPGDAS